MQCGGMSNSNPDQLPTSRTAPKSLRGGMPPAPLGKGDKGSSLRHSRPSATLPGPERAEMAFASPDTRERGVKEGAQPRGWAEPIACGWTRRAWQRNREWGQGASAGAFPVGRCSSCPARCGAFPNPGGRREKPALPSSRMLIQELLPGIQPVGRHHQRHQRHHHPSVHLEEWRMPGSPLPPALCPSSPSMCDTGTLWV